MFVVTYLLCVTILWYLDLDWSKVCALSNMCTLLKFHIILISMSV